MEQMKVNHRSDFTLRLTLCDLQGERLNLHAANLTLNFFTATPAVAYTASLRAGVCSNCRIEPDGTLLVVFNDHRLPLGALQCRMTLLIEDDTFPDGTRRQVLSVPTNCIISTENSDVDLSATLQVHAPLLKGERGEGGEGGGGGTLTEEAIQGITADITATLLNNPSLKGKDGKDGKDGRDGTDGQDGGKGDKGDKGEPFTFADFTPEQLAALKGADGKDGKDGEQGTQGPQGVQGERGEQGLQGEKGDKGDKGDQGIQGAKGDKGADGKDAQVTQAQLDSIAQAVKTELQATLPTGGSATITPEAEQAIVNKAAKQAFIKQWNTECGVFGQYNPETDLFELNGLTDITESQAREIMRVGRPIYIQNGSTLYASKKTGSPRTVLPPYVGMNLVKMQIPEIGELFGVEVFRFCTYYDDGRNAPSGQGFNCSNTNSFAGSSAAVLRKVLPKIILTSGDGNGSYSYEHFYNNVFSKMEEIWLSGICEHINAFKTNNSLKFECWKYMIDNASTSIPETRPVMIQVTADTYAKFTNANGNTPEWKEVLDKALSLNISFTTSTIPRRTTK